MRTKSVVTRLDGLLGALGFVRHNATWNRKSVSFVDVVDVQTSKTGDRITVNAGVLHPDVHRTCWATEPPVFVEETSCTVRARVGQLVDGKDLWWPLEGPGVWDDVHEKVTHYVLPFFERMHAINAMEQFLINLQVTRQSYPPPTIYLAILMNERGDKSGACALLSELRKRTTGGWKTRIGEVNERLACK